MPDAVPGPAHAPASVLRGVDRAAFVTAMALRLRRAGVPVGLTATEDLARALVSSRLHDLGSAYWVTRVTLVRRHEDLAVFDRVFAEVFDLETGVLDRQPPTRGHPRPQTRGSAAGPDAAGSDGGGDADSPLPWATLPAVTGLAETEMADLLLLERRPSQVAGLADVPFEDLDDEQLALLTTWLAQAWSRWPTRVSRRRRVAASGSRIELRSTLGRARHTGWEPIELRRSAPVRRRRPFVLLCDVSQSMQTYTSAYLHVMRAATLAADAEVFAFATGLTRLTPALRHKETSVALAQATEQVTDRFGGTRIAASLTAVLKGRHASSLRGAVVVVASDGWDSDPPDDLRRAMERLSRRAHRVVWLNPRIAAASYRPLVGSMAAALPYCDAFLPAHTTRTLTEALIRIADH